MIESLKSLLAEAEASVDHLPPDDPVASTGGQCEQRMDLPNFPLDLVSRARL